MRLVSILALLFVTACVAEKLALAPPPGVDFSGQWRLNDADSDDPQRVTLSQNGATPNNPAGSAGGQGGSGGQGRRGGGRGTPNTGGYGAGPLAPTAPGVGALSDGLHWPGRELEIKQTAGVVTITSMGTQEIYRPQPKAAARPKPTEGAGRDDPRGRAGDELPVCGWDDKTLVVEAESPEDEHPAFEQRYSLSDDGQRLIEVIAFQAGRSRGFTVSRVWDRAPAPHGS
jgi:hypothetical protein